MRLATVRGIPIRLHWSFFVLVALLAAGGARAAGVSGVLATLGLTTGLFVSVALHELGHALTAERFGIRTRHITLYPFGGVAAIERMPTLPGQELAIALAGPAVNFGLTAMAGWVWGATGSTAMLTLAVMNLVMGVFNLVPAFPMDGGRVLRALLSQRMGHWRATDLSIRIGRGFAWLFLAVGVYLWMPSLLMVGAFLHFALTAERAQLTRQAFAQWHPRDPFGSRRWSARPG
ncbi:MAG: site-2 protease family protein [Deltaproteobacteria bacterium]|nr:site-2 protease family protein [Deltaproteobacteria bacterium]